MIWKSWPTATSSCAIPICSFGSIRTTLRWTSVSSSPACFRPLRVAIDSDRGRVGRFVITVSTSHDPLNALSESLAGQVAIVELSPSSAAEAHLLPPSGFFDRLAKRLPARDFLDLPLQLDLVQRHDYWLRGGYPEPWLKNQPRFGKLWMQNYLQT